MRIILLLCEQWCEARKGGEWAKTFVHSSKEFLRVLATARYLVYIYVLVRCNFFLIMAMTHVDRRLVTTVSYSKFLSDT